MNRKERRTAAKQNRTGGKAGVGTESDRRVGEAIALAQAEALGDAEKILAEVLRKDARHVEAKHHLGMIMARTGRADAGIAMLREVVAAKPLEPLYWNNLAASCLAVNRTAEAAEAAKRAAGIDSKYAMAWENLGLASRDLREYAAGAAAFHHAAALGDLPPGSLRAWAICLLESGDPAAAERVLRTVIGADENDADALALLGEALQGQKRIDEAGEALRRSLRIKPDQLGAALHFGGILIRTGDVDGGLRWLRRATSIAPRSAAAWQVLSNALKNAGRAEEATEAVRHAARLAPSEDPEMSALMRRIVGSEGIRSGAALSLADTGLEMEIGKPQPAAKPIPGGGLDLTLLDIKE